MIVRAVSLLAFAVLFAGSVRGQESKIVVDGEARGLADVKAMRQESQQRLAALGTSEEEEAKARRADLEAEAKVLADAISLLERLGGFESRKEKLTAELERLRGELTAARTAATEPISFESMSEERLGNLEREAAARKQEVTQAQAAETDAKGRLDKRRDGADGLDALGGTIESLSAELAAARKAREEETAEEKHPDLDRRARTAEVRLRIAELKRDRHASLLELDSLASDVARTAAELARQKHARADAVVAAARTARQQQLAREAEDSRLAAEAKRRQAQLANSPTEKACANLEAFVAQLQGEGKEDQATKARLDAVVSAAKHDLDWAHRELALVESLFPKEGRLDAWKVEALVEELAKLERHREEFAEVRAATGTPEVILRGVISLRDRLESLQELVEGTRSVPPDQLPERVFESYQQVWLDAISGFHAGLPELRPAEVSRYREVFDTLTDRLLESITSRLPILQGIEDQAAATAKVFDDVDRALIDISRHLETVSLWLRTEPPLSGSELRAAGDELGRLGDALIDTPAVVSREWGRLRLPAALPWSVIAVVLLAFFLGIRLTRRLRSSSRAEEFFAGLDALQRLQRIVGLSLARALGPLALALAAFALERARPGRPALVTFEWLAAAWAVSRLLRGANGALYENDGSGARLMTCEDATSRRALRLGALIAIVVPGLLAASQSLDVGGFRKLAVLGRIASIALLLGVALWLVVFGRDVLALTSPREGGGPFRRATRAILPVVWPLAFTFFAGVFVLLILGYRNAAWFYGSRSLLCAGAFAAAFLVYHVVWAVTARRMGLKTEGEDVEHDLQPGRAVEPVDLYRRLARAFILFAVVVGLVIALSAILDLGPDEWREIGATLLLPGTGSAPGLTLAEVVKAVLIFWITLNIARFVRDALKIVLAERTGKGASYVIRTLTFYSLAAFGVGFALAALGLQLDKVGWFFTAATVGLGFGLQEIVSNFVAGLILFFERPVQVGDIITVGEIEGDVVRINIRSTVVRTRDGISIILPNKRLITDDVVNWSHGDQRTRLTLPISVAYGSDVPLVKKLLLEIAEDESRVLSRPKPEADFIAFGESELQFKLLVWLPHPDITLRRRVTSEINSAVDAAFRENGIEIPFPQRDIHVRSTPDDDAPDAPDSAAEAS